MIRLGALLFCLLCAGLSVEAEAQRAERADRLDRLDRIQDRVAARDRMVNRAIADRVRVRKVTDAAPLAASDEPVRDVPDLPEADADAALDETDTRTATIILDPFGDRIRRGEILALNPSPEALAELSRRNLREVRQRDLAGDAILYLFRSPGAMNLGDVLERLQRLDPNGLYSPNHVYEPQAEPEPVITGDIAASLPLQATGEACTIGLIDGPVEALPAPFDQAIAATQRFHAGAVSQSPHGALVAYRLIDAADRLGGRRSISICAADVFAEGPQTAITAEAIAGALHWQMAQAVKLINASLSGPDNAIVAWSVERYLASGGTLVAAVGNGGPLSRNIYPAAYDGVIGVTAVNASGQVYALASQGVHVDIAARGVDIDASPVGVASPLSGTSFAAPLVTSWLAVHQRSIDQAEAVLIDHGALGRDAQFGLGELRLQAQTVRVSAAPAPAAPR